MPYDEGLAHRVRSELRDHPGLDEREMFGGLAFMLDGNLCCGVLDDRLIARVGPDAHEDALDEPHARPFDFTGRSMRGIVFVEPAGLASDDALRDWIDRAVGFVETLPAK